MTARVSAERLGSFVESMFVAAGVPADEAATVAASLVVADLRGKSSHGVTRVPAYLTAFRAGSVVSPTRISVVRETSTTLVLDGGNGWGQVIGVDAMDRCIAKARMLGTAFAAVRRSSHFGFPGYFAERAARVGLIGLAFSNGAWRSGFVAPWGGRDRLFDTNPMAFAFPSAGGAPLIVDMATSQVARGRLTLAVEANQPIPSGWGLDAEGQPTTDGGAALTGSLAPLGGYKGYALALVVDILCGALAGDVYPDPPGSGQFFGVLDPVAFAPASPLADEVAAAVSAIKQQRPAVGVDEIYVPGERSAQAESIARRDGVLLSDLTLDRLAVEAATLGLDAADLLSD